MSDKEEKQERIEFDQSVTNSLLEIEKIIHMFENKLTPLIENRLESLKSDLTQLITNRESDNDRFATLEAEVKQIKMQFLGSAEYASDINEIAYLNNKRRAVADFLMNYYNLDNRVGLPIFKTSDGKTIPHPFLTKGNWRADNIPIDFQLSLVEDFGDESYLPDNFSEIVKARKEEAARNNKVFVDRELYRLISIDHCATKRDGEVVNSIKLDFEISSYSRFVITCRELSRELDSALEMDRHFVERYQETTKQERSLFFDTLRTKLPYRNSIVPHVDSFVDNLMDRTGKMGIDMVFIFRNKSRYSCLIQQRSYNVLEQPGAFGVVPAGTFQAPHKVIQDAGHRRKFFDFKVNVLRELYEEVFGGKEVEDLKNEDISHEEMIEHPPIRDFTRCINENKAGIFFTGFGFSFIHSGPGVVGFIVVTDPTFYENNQEYLVENWESSGIEIIDFSREGLDPFMMRGDMMPCAATAVIQALQHWRKYVITYLSEY